MYDSSICGKYLHVLSIPSGLKSWLVKAPSGMCHASFKSRSLHTNMHPARQTLTNYPFTANRGGAKASFR